MSRDVLSDETWALLRALFPPAKQRGRPPVNRRLVVEAVIWRFRKGAPWRDLPERFGNWNTIYRNFDRWAKIGVWAQLLEHVQGFAEARGGLAMKTHLVCDGKGRPLGFAVTGGQVADTIMLPTTMDQIRVPTAGRPRRRPDRLRADKGYPSRANRAWLRARDVKTTIPERADQIAHRRKKPGRPIVFDPAD